MGTQRRKAAFLMISVYTTSAFCKDGCGGNKAGVVLDRPDLSTAQKLAIAREMGYSETAFVTRSLVADYKLEYFTPAEEVPLCGHATIAAFVTLSMMQALDKSQYRIETKAGILDIQVNPDGLILMEQNRPDYGETIAPQVLEGILPTESFCPDIPIQIVSTGLKDVMLPICSPEQLAAMTPDFGAMSRFSRAQGVVGIHAFALTPGEEYTAICRNFAPLYGIDEESATGTSNCALACYLYRHSEKKTRYIFEQGHNLGQVSRIIVQLECGDGEILRVFVGGFGRLLGELELELD